MNPVKIQIAPLNPDEVEAVARAHAVMQAATYAPFAAGDFTGLLFSYMEDRAEEWLAADRAAVAKTERGSIVGVAMVAEGPQEWETKFDPNFVPPVTNRYLATLFTMPGTHGTGLGSKLLNAVLEPEEDVYLWTMTENPRAIRFYEKHGFKPDGYGRNTTDWGGMDMIRMVRLP